MNRRACADGGFANGNGSTVIEHIFDTCGERDTVTHGPMCYGNDATVPSGATRVRSTDAMKEAGDLSYHTEAAGLTLESVRDYAEHVGKHYRVYDGDGAADLEKLVRILGGTVRVGAAPESLVVHEEGSFTIHIPLTTSSRRDRFTVAHELGHYFLHYLYPQKKGEERFGRGLTNRAETEANTFASSLLMPAEQFRSAWSRCNGDIYALSRTFNVSPRAAEVRRDVLGLRSSAW